jgi:TPR repeat protein
LLNGRGVGVDLRLAVHYLKLLANQGNAGAQFAYGVCLLDGRGVGVDLRLAVHYSKLSADQGNPACRRGYGLCLQNGCAIEINVRLTADYSTLAADKGDAPGQCCNGDGIAKGTGIEMDLGLAGHYFQLVADEGDPEALFLVGHRLLHPDIGDHSAAARYCQLSAGGGHTPAQLTFARFLEEGIGVPADHIQAAKYWELAPEVSAVGCACYGWCCQKGRGVPISFIEAADFFRMAAVGGNADGQNGLAN